MDKKYLKRQSFIMVGLLASIVLSYFLGVVNIFNFDNFSFKIVRILLLANITLSFLIFSSIGVELAYLLLIKKIKHNIYAELLLEEDLEEDYNWITKNILKHIEQNNVFRFFFREFRKNKLFKTKNDYNYSVKFFSEWIDFRSLCEGLLTTSIFLIIYDLIAMIMIIISPSSYVVSNFILFNVIYFSLAFLMNILYLKAVYNEHKDSILRDAQNKIIYRKFKKQRTRLNEIFNIDILKIEKIIEVYKFYYSYIDKKELKKMNSKLLRISDIASIVKEKDVTKEMREKIIIEVDRVLSFCEKVLNTKEREELEQERKKEKELKEQQKKEKAEKLRREKERERELNKRLEKL